MAGKRKEVLPIKLTYLFLFIAGFGAPRTEKNKKLLKISFVVINFIQVISIVITGHDFVYTCFLGTFNDFIYTLINVLTNGIISVKFVSMLCQRSYYQKLLGIARDTLWTKPSTEYGESLLKACDKEVLFYLIVFSILAQSVAITYIVEPIVLNFQKNTSDPNNRHLPFKVWFNFPAYTTPYYEIIFVTQVIASYYAAIVYICFDNYMGLVNIFIVGRLNILKHRIQELYVNSIVSPPVHVNSNTMREKYKKNNPPLSDISKEFKECVRQHQFLIWLIGEIGKVYAFICLVQVLLLSFLICLVGYQLIMPDQPLMRRSKFIVYIGGSLSQLYIFANTCDNVMTASTGLSDGIYHSDWYSVTSSKEGRLLVRDFMMLIMRTQRPCGFSGGGFFPVTINTFKSTLSTAFSYLTLIRKSGH